MKKYDETKVLERFMNEFFPFKEFNREGVFTSDMKDDYEAQAKRICDLLGYESVYQYRAHEIRAHITYTEGGRPIGEPFLIVIPSIYD